MPRQRAGIQHRPDGPGLVGLFRSCERRDLAGRAERLDAGESVTVLGYTLYRAFGREYFPHAHHARCTVQPDGTVDESRCLSN